jgi:hypothetical protein
MQATYTIKEVKILLRSLETTEVRVLKEIISEETECYSVSERKAINKMISFRLECLCGKRPHPRFSLSFN